ncbi:MAG TPA: nucleotidyltransferase domain-containing protein [Stellaceae bacterium]|nr:nucleotidyltransferase domain-containing protein [Stellaceae bacterium]
MVMRLNEAISRLRARQADLKRLGVEGLYVFGSTARDDARADSDIDLFFDYEGRFGLFDLLSVKELAAEILGTHTDIMTRGSLHPLIRNRAEGEALRVF